MPGPMPASSRGDGFECRTAQVVTLRIGSLAVQVQDDACEPGVRSHRREGRAHDGSHAEATEGCVAVSHSPRNGGPEARDQDVQGFRCRRRG